MVSISLIILPPKFNIYGKLRGIRKAQSQGLKKSSIPKAVKEDLALQCIWLEYFQQLGKTCQHQNFHKIKSQERHEIKQQICQYKQESTELQTKGCFLR